MEKKKTTACKKQRKIIPSNTTQLKTNSINPSLICTAYKKKMTSLKSAWSSLKPKMNILRKMATTF